MGKILSSLSRPLRNYNIENRAIKQISKPKPTPAPRHPSTVKHLEATRAAPSSKEFVKIPPEHLERLKKVYVTSEDPVVHASDSESEKKKRPKSKEYLEEPEYGYMEPEVIPKGKLSMRQAVELITRHQSEPERWNADLIAKEYRLDLGITQKVLFYYRAYELWLPPTDRPEQWKEKTKKFIVHKHPEPPLPQIK